METIILPAQSSKRIYDKFLAYEEENLIKIGFLYSKYLLEIFNSESYEDVVVNYIDQLANKEAIELELDFEYTIETLQSKILETLTFEEFTNILLRKVYKLSKQAVESYDEMEGDEY